MPDELLTVQRALDVLALFSTDRPDWGVTEVAAELGLAKSQAHRLLTTLAGRSYVVVDPRTRSYRLGPALIGLGQVASRSDGTRQLALPVLRRLAATSGHSAQLNVYDGPQYVLAAAAQSPSELQYEFTVGRRYPWYGGAAGHAIYAFRDPAEIQSFLALGFTQSAERGAHTPEELLARHAATRLRGWAHSAGEFDPRTAAVGAPVRAAGQVVASVIVIAAVQALEPDLDRMGAEVVRAAAELSDVFSTGRAVEALPPNSSPNVPPRGQP
ncbi:IclR family transcriptional regulator [Kineococcus sp. SYSU DK003]|uniref:IclR family transcriptional regulator n=1 Tax=Kineococcus sp. SYSU DK003 TaxID=3383124 RepID=UPI003D7C69E3